MYNPSHPSHLVLSAMPNSDDDDSQGGVRGQIKRGGSGSGNRSTAPAPHSTHSSHLQTASNGSVNSSARERNTDLRTEIGNRFSSKSKQTVAKGASCRQLSQLHSPLSPLLSTSLSSYETYINVRLLFNFGAYIASSFVFVFCELLSALCVLFLSFSNVPYPSRSLRLFYHSLLVLFVCVLDLRFHFARSHFATLSLSFTHVESPFLSSSQTFARSLHPTFNFYPRFLTLLLTPHFSITLPLRRSLFPATLASLERARKYTGRG